MATSQRPLELILARNLLSSLSTPAMLVNREGDVVFYNEAAGALLGRRFEETGTVPAAEWVETFGPIDEHDRPIPIERQPLTAELRANRAGHASHRIRSLSGTCYDIAVSAFPIIGVDGSQGAIVLFWEVSEETG